jgi:hypothetical protein
VSESERKNPRVVKQPQERHVVIMDETGTHHYILAPDALCGLGAAERPMPGGLGLTGGSALKGRKQS